MALRSEQVATLTFSCMPLIFYRGIKQDQKFIMYVLHHKETDGKKMKKDVVIEDEVLSLTDIN